MNKLAKDVTLNELQQIGIRITDGVGQIIEQSKRTIAVYLNSEVSITYWRIGKYIAGELNAIGEEKYGSKIAATLSHQLTWSHFVELVTIPQPAKRLFYQQLSILNGWSVRQLRDQEEAMAYDRTLIASKPEDEQNITVAQYLTVLPKKQWFIDKMNRAITIARELQNEKEASTC
jgi:hypothetical protein